jgi:hypothetical protein
MKLDSLFSHAFGFFPHAHPHVEESHGSTAATPATETQPTLVFRGIRYHKDQAATDAALPAHPEAPHVFRGIRYTPSSPNSGLDVVRRQMGVRIFRGNVVA